MVAFWEGDSYTWMDDYKDGFLRDAPDTQQWFTAFYWAITTVRVSIFFTTIAISRVTHSFA